MFSQAIANDKPATAKRKPLNILIVDGDDCCGPGLKGMIEEAGHHAAVVRTCRGAMEIISGGRFDLIFLEIHLPDCMGYELIPRLREQWPDVKIVAMTANNSRKTETLVREQDITSYMIKPIGNRELRIIADHVSKMMGPRFPINHGKEK